MAKTAEQMASNWKRAMQDPSTAAKYKQGIQNTTVNPMELAASDQSEQLFLRKVTASVQSGRRSAKLRAVPRERWSNNAVNVGSNNLSSGALKATDKVSAHFQKWQPIYVQSSAAAHALPKGGASNALARVAANMKVLMEAAGTA